MNYIKQLEQENKEMSDCTDACNAAITDFIRLLNLPKHNGVDVNGERSDWIATSDCLAQLRLIRNTLKW